LEEEVERLLMKEALVLLT
jgi:hypothetical protein